MNEMLIQCTDLNIGATIGNINLSIIAYCDDIVLLSPSEKHAEMLLKTCEQYATYWKFEFNASKSATISFCKKNSNFVPNFKMNGVQIPRVSGFIYLGLPIGDQSTINDFIENKMKKVERSFYSLNGLGCRPKMMKPETVSFLYKQFAQSIFRYHLDNIYISEKRLNEFDIRQNILIK